MMSNLPDNDNTAEVEYQEAMTEQDWLDIANRAYDDSDTYLDTALRKRLERNYSLSLSKHPTGSKYYTESYKHRSRIFRGKTASAIRKNMAACALALFSTQDVVSITPEDDNDEEGKIASKAIDLICNYHLNTSIPWYRVANGAYKEAMINGFVFSKQWWAWDSVIVDDEEVITRDEPVIELMPPENVRISPASDWLDPVNTSPYLILSTPMFVGDIKNRMELDWFKHDTEKISAAIKEEEYDSIRKSREGDKPDSKTESVSVKDHDIAWVRENFVNHDGICHCYYTLGRSLLLSAPAQVMDVYPHCIDGKPPVRMGVNEIEPFSTYPQSMVERTEGLQIQANELVNQRFDNVQQVLNKRWVAQRGKNVDYRSLTKNVPGSVTMTDDVNAVKPMVTNDVTSSSYNEQNLLNMDFDELSGSFATSSVATNRQLNETVGGMQLLAGHANVLTEFPLRTFVESWVEPVMRDLVGMVKTYEGTERIQKITGIREINHASLQKAVITRVNVGFGSTDPQQKVNRLMFALSTLSQLMANPKLAGAMNLEEISAEVFGAVGFRDGARFVPGLKEDGNPQIKQLQQQLQQLQQEIEQKKAEKQMDFQLAQFKAQVEMQKEQARAADNENERQSREKIAEMELRKTAAELALKEDVTLKEMNLRLGIKEMEHNTKLQIKELDGRQQERKQADDLKSKIYTQKITGEKGLWPG